MPITTKITHKLSDRHYVAAGAYKSLSSAQTGPVSMLLEKTDNGYKPILDSTLHASKIMDREVISYIDAKEVVSNAQIGESLDLTVVFKLK